MKQELKEIIGHHYSFNLSDDTLSKYSNNFDDKNEKIQQLFKDSDNGRIVIPLKDVLDRDLFLEYGINPLENFEVDVLEEMYRSSRFSLSSVRLLLEGFESVLSSELVSLEDGKAIQSPYLSNSTSGVKIGKMLNTLLDINLIKYGKTICIDDNLTEDSLKEWIRITRNVIIGGKIAGLISSVSTTEQYQDVSLTLSINPSDFFTMSYGTSWSSCMEPEGDYGGGTLPYASGADTIIAFIDSGDYRKKWRQLIFINEDNYLLTSRPYPGERDLLTLIASSFINNECNLGLKISTKSNIKNSVTSVAPYGDYGKEFGYVDIFRRHTGRGYFIFAPTGDNPKKVVRIKAQKYHGCLECGDTDDSWAGESYCLCSSCESSYSGEAQCELCGDRYHEDSVYYVESINSSVCEYCLEHGFVWSDWSDEYIEDDDAVSALMYGHRIYESVSVTENDLVPLTQIKPTIEIENLPSDCEYVDSSLLEDSEDIRYSYQFA